MAQCTWTHMIGLITYSAQPWIPITNILSHQDVSIDCDLSSYEHSCNCVDIRILAIDYPVETHLFLTVRLAKLKLDAVLRAPYCETSVLYPTTGANILSFTAVVSCAVLDVLIPPYKEDPAYYRVHPYSSRLLREGTPYWLLIFLQRIELKYYGNWFM